MSTPRGPRPPAGNAGAPADDDNDNDVPRDAALSALYRQLPASVPQAQTDAAILAAARRAAHARPRSLQRWHRWSLPLATAASVLLVLTILHRQEVPELAAPAAVEEAYVQAAPEKIAPEMTAPDTAPAPVVAAAEAPALAAAADAPAVPAARAVAKVQALPDAGGTRTGNAGNDDAVRAATPAVAVEESLPATGAGPGTSAAATIAAASPPAPAAEQREVVARKSVAARQRAASERHEAMVAGEMAALPPDGGFARYIADMTVLSTEDAGDGARLWHLRSPDLALLRARLAADGWQALAGCPAWPGGVHARGEEEAGWSLPNANGIVTLRVGTGTCPP